MTAARAVASVDCSCALIRKYNVSIEGEGGVDPVWTKDAMLTALQISDARVLLGWSRADLSRKAVLKLDVIDQAEDRDGNALLHYGQEIAIRRVCERAGIEFIDHPPSVRMRELRPTPPI